MGKIFLFLSFYILSISWVTSQNIEEETKMYFQSESFKKCENIWKKYRESYENTLAKALRDGYGHKTMNVYVKRPKDALLLSTGYYHSDNQVDILFQDILLEEFPYLLNPEISFNLCGNSLFFESSLSRMIIHSDYYLFRNTTDVIYKLKDQDSYLNSPFRFQQVRNTGQMAISAERCRLVGKVFIRMDGQTVIMGVDMLKLRSCQFNVDVYTPGQKTPPVLADYLFQEDRSNEKNILVQALSKEFMPQLQATLASYVNTSDIFGEDLLYIEHKQKVAMATVESYIDNTLRDLNKQTIEKNMGTVALENFNINWNDAFDGNEKDCEIRLTQMTLSGLDSAYSSHIGGPYKVEGIPIKITERLKMSYVQVIGVISLQGIHEGEYNFAADIYDVNIEMTIDVQQLEDKRKGIDNNEQKHECIVSGWRSLEFSCPDLEELPIEAIVTGYLINSLPEYLVDPISNYYKQIKYDDLKQDDIHDIPLESEENLPHEKQVLSISNDKAVTDNSAMQATKEHIDEKRLTDNEVGKDSNTES